MSRVITSLRSDKNGIPPSFPQGARVPEGARAAGPEKGKAGPARSRGDCGSRSLEAEQTPRLGGHERFAPCLNPALLLCLGELSSPPPSLGKGAAWPPGAKRPGTPSGDVLGGSLQPVMGGRVMGRGGELNLRVSRARTHTFERQQQTLGRAACPQRQGAGSCHSIIHLLGLLEIYRWHYPMQRNSLFHPSFSSLQAH